MRISYGFRDSYTNNEKETLQKLNFIDFMSICYCYQNRVDAMYSKKNYSKFKYLHHLIVPAHIVVDIAVELVFLKLVVVVVEVSG